MVFKKITEQPSHYNNLESMSVSDLLHGINNEDQKVAAAVREAIPQVEKLVTAIVDRMWKGGRVFYLGAGTSGRLGTLDASELPPTFGITPDRVIAIIAGGDKALKGAVESAEDNPDKSWEELQAYAINKNDVVIGIAASGTTPYVIGALEHARAEGILTASISCNPESPVSQAADIAIEVIVGPEFVTGSTRMKAGTAEKMVLNMISTATMIRLGRVKGNKMVNMQLTNKKLVDRATRIIIEETGLDYQSAKALLLEHKSVRMAVEAYRSVSRP